MSVLEAAIGWLAPPDCLVCGAEGEAICQTCFTSGINPFGERCWRCNLLSPTSRTCGRCRPAGPLGHVWINTNYEGLAQQLIQKYKFGHQRVAARTLAQHMVGTYSRSACASKDYLVIPIPTATSRVRQRGFDHGQLLAKAIASELKLQYLAGLGRLGQSRQLGAKRERRLIQLADSFAIKNRRQIVGRDILLIDDVLTTGGTLISAAKCLKQAGANQIDAMIFAKRL